MKHIKLEAYFLKVISVFTLLTFSTSCQDNSRQQNAHEFAAEPNMVEVARCAQMLDAKIYNIKNFRQDMPASIYSGKYIVFKESKDYRLEDHLDSIINLDSMGLCVVSDNNQTAGLNLEDVAIQKIAFYNPSSQRMNFDLKQHVTGVASMIGNLPIFSWFK